GGPSLVDGDRQEPEGVLVQDHAAGRDRGEGLGEGHAPGLPAEPDLDAVAQHHADALQLGAADVQGDVTEVVHQHHLAVDVVVVDPRAWRGEPAELGRVQLGAEQRRVDPGGEVGGGRGEHVAAVGGLGD